jgi:exodeoxyribonuclease VII small subunit
MPKSKTENLSFEESFQRLETIVQNLESGESTLEEAMKDFEEGMRLVKHCSKKLNEAETRLQRLVKGEDGEFQLQPEE